MAIGMPLKAGKGTTDILAEKHTATNFDERQIYFSDARSRYHEPHLVLSFMARVTLS
jgi:hypothetical protein